MIAVNTWRGAELRPHRGGECRKCDGTGVDVYGCEHPAHDSYDGDECPHRHECEVCDGWGHVLWAWRPDIAADAAVCSLCRGEDVKTMGYGEDGLDGEVCLACYLAWHARECGCGLWPREVTP